MEPPPRSSDYVSLVQFREGSVAPEFVGPSDDLVHLVRFWISPSTPDVNQVEEPPEELRITHRMLDKFLKVKIFYSLVDLHTF